jgi:hypothetical protein
MAPAERLRGSDLVRSDFVASSAILESDRRSQTGPDLGGSASGCVTAFGRLIVGAIEDALDPVVIVVSGGAAILQGRWDPPVIFGGASKGSP